MKEKLYRFFWDCRRMGELEGIFVSTEEHVAEMIGKEVYFGEVLGKHSQIQGTLESDDFQVLTDDQAFIEKAFQLKVIPSGFNPFDYIEEEDEEEDDDN